MRRFYYKIKRIIEWLPVLWRTEDYDHAYATEIWAYSLERLRDQMLAGYGVITKTKLRKINTAINLLKRISRDHEYTDKHFDDLVKQYGRLTVKCLDDDHKPWPKEGYNKLRDLYKLEEKLFKQDVGLLAKILERHLRGWWD